MKEKVTHMQCIFETLCGLKFDVQYMSTRKYDESLHYSNLITTPMIVKGFVSSTAKLSIRLCCDTVSGVVTGVVTAAVVVCVVLAFCCEIFCLAPNLSFVVMSCGLWW